MKAYRYNEELSLEAVPLELKPEREDDIVVKTRLAYLGPEDCPTRSADNPIAEGYFPGKAFVGEVEQTGHAATHLLGKTVLVGDHQPCGECPPCRRAQSGACGGSFKLGDNVGALATHGRASSRWAIALEDGLEIDAPETPAVAGALALAYSLFIKAAVTPGDNVKIVGDGTIGDMANQLRTHFAVREPKNSASPVRILETTSSFTGRQKSIALAAPGAKLSWLHRNAAKAPDVSTLGPMSASLAWVTTSHPDLLTEVLALVVRQEIDLSSAVDVVPLETALENWQPDRGRVVRL